MTCISERGQIVIPKYFREMLGWQVDTPLRFSLDKNKLVVEKRESIADDMERFAKECNVGLKGKLDFDDEYDAAILKKYKKMGLL
ncbi:AbrB/MazE/SpoVT family DNA-binding domain-containing protein [Candidatus Parvarchaeota archaeon]|nr:AbrB/MazE/SpoVT family DNA-binding domain-containing protein [Candidatus Parvarchaeota archaeon]